MEDYSGIIWVVIFGAAMLFSAFSKARRKQQADSGNPHEAWPTLFGDEDTEQPHSASEHTSSSYDSIGESEPVVPYTPERPFMASEYSGTQISSTPELSSEKSENHTKSIKNTDRYAPTVSVSSEMTTGRILFEKDESNTPVSDEAPEEGPLKEFNLRDGVLYSEILKPKFDE